MKSLLRDPLTEWKRMIESNIESMQKTRSTYSILNVSSSKPDSCSSQAEQKHANSEVRDDASICSHELLNERNEEFDVCCHQTELSHLDEKIDPGSNGADDKIFSRITSEANQTEENQECLCNDLIVDDECDCKRHVRNNEISLFDDNNVLEENVDKSEGNLTNNHSKASNICLNLETDSRLFHLDYNFVTGCNAEVSNRLHDKETMEANMCLVNEAGYDGKCSADYKNTENYIAKKTENNDGINTNEECVNLQLSLKNDSAADRDNKEADKLNYTTIALNNTENMSRGNVITRDLNNHEINKRDLSNYKRALRNGKTDLRNCNRSLSNDKRDLINNKKDIMNDLRDLSNCRAGTRELSKISVRDNDKSFITYLNNGTLKVGNWKIEKTYTRSLSNDSASARNLSNTNDFISNKESTKDISKDTIGTRVLRNVKVHARDVSNGRLSTNNLSNDKANARDLSGEKKDNVKRDLSYDRRDLGNGKRSTRGLSYGKKEFSRRNRVSNNGKRDLSNGKRDLSNGNRDLSNGKRDLSNGKRDLSNGKRDLSNGKRDLSNGNKDLSNGKRDLSNGKRDLSNGNRDLSNGKRDLSNGKRDLSNGKRNLINGNRDLSNGNKDLSNGKRDLSNGKRDLSNGKIDLSNGKRDLSNGKRDLSNGNRELSNGKIDLSNGKRDLSNGKRDLSNGNRDLSNGKRDLSNGKRDLSNGKRDLSHGKRNLINGNRDLSNGNKDLSNGKRDLSNGNRDLSNGNRDLSNGKIDLSNDKRYLSNGKRDLSKRNLSNGKRDLSNGKRDLSNGKTNTQDQSIGKTNTGDLNSAKRNLSKDQRNLSNVTSGFDNGKENVSNGKIITIDLSKINFSNDTTKTGELKSCNSHTRDLDNGKDSTRDLGICKQNIRDLSNCEKVLSNDKNSADIINKNDNSSTSDKINGKTYIRDMNNSKIGTDKDEYITGGLSDSNGKTNTEDINNGKDSTSVMSNDNVRKRSMSNGKVNIRDVKNRKVNRRHLSNAKFIKKELDNENVIDKVTGDGNINALDFYDSKTRTRNLCNDKSSARFLSNEKTSTQILSNEKTSTQILSNEKTSIQILSNGKVTNCNELLKIKCQSGLCDMGSVVSLENIISKYVDKNYEQTLISSETSILNMDTTKFKFNVKDINEDGTESYYYEAADASSAAQKTTVSRMASLNPINIDTTYWLAEGVQCCTNSYDGTQEIYIPGMTNVQGEHNSVKNFSCGDGYSGVYASSKKICTNTVGLQPLQTFKQKRIHKCCSVGNIAVRNRRGRERKCKTGSVKYETVGTTSSVDVKMPHCCITRAKSASEECKRRHGEHIDYISIQHLELEPAANSKRHFSNLNQSWIKGSETPENESHGKLKHLTRNPMTEWKRLVDINMESMLNCRVSDVDRAKYGGGDFEVSMQSKVKDDSDTVLEKRYLKLEPSLQQASVLKTAENDKCCQSFVDLMGNKDATRDDPVFVGFKRNMIYEKIAQTENNCVCIDNNNVYSRVAICDIIHTPAPTVSINNKDGETNNEYEKETSLNTADVETTLLNYKIRDKSTYCAGYKEILGQEHLSQGDQCPKVTVDTKKMHEDDFSVYILNESNILDVASVCGQDAKMNIHDSKLSFEIKQMNSQHEINLCKENSGRICLLGSILSSINEQNSVVSDLSMSKVIQVNHADDCEKLEMEERYMALYQSDSGSKVLSPQNANTIPDVDKIGSVITQVKCTKDGFLTPPINNVITDSFSILDNCQKNISQCKNDEIFNDTLGDSCFSSDVHTKVPDKLFSLRQVESENVWNQCSRTYDTKYNFQSTSQQTDSLDVVRHIHEINEQKDVSSDHLLPLQESKGRDKISSDLFTKYKPVDKKVNKTTIEVLDELALPQDIDNKPPTTVWSRFSSFMTSIFRGSSKEMTSNINQMLQAQQFQNNKEHNFIGHTNKKTCLEAKVFNSNLRNDNYNNEERSSNDINIGINVNGGKCITKGNMLPNGISITGQAKVPSINLLDETSNSAVGMSTAENFSLKISKEKCKNNLFHSINLGNKCLTPVPSEYKTYNDNSALKVNPIHTKPGCEVSDEEKTLPSSGMHELVMKNTNYSHSFQRQKRFQHFKTKIPVLISHSYNRKSRKYANMNTLNIIGEEDGIGELIYEYSENMRSNNRAKTGTFTTNVRSNDPELINIITTQTKNQNMTYDDLYNEENISKYEVSIGLKEKTETDDFVSETKNVENKREKCTAESSNISVSRTNGSLNTVQNVDVSIAIKEKLYVVTDTMLNEPALSDCFKNDVKSYDGTEPRARELNQLVPGCCGEESTELVASDLLQYSLECLLEMLLQRGKVNHAVVANVDGEIIAKTANFDFTTSDIKSLIYSLSSTYQGMVKIAIFNDVYTCFKHGQESSLIGKADAGIFVAQRGQQSIVVGFSDPQTPGSCIKEIQEISQLLHKRGL